MKVTSFIVQLSYWTHDKTRHRASLQSEHMTTYDIVPSRPAVCNRGLSDIDLSVCLCRSRAGNHRNTALCVCDPASACMHCFCLFFSLIGKPCTSGMQAAVEAKQVLLRQAYKQATEAEDKCKQLQQRLHDALEHSRCVSTVLSFLML